MQWKRYQTHRPTEDLLRGWYELEGRKGVGLVCGAVSGNLEMLEFEGQAVLGGLHNRYRELAQQAGAGELLSRVLSGYTERTPGGGFHIFYRCATRVDGNLKLARRPATAEELAARPEDKIRVLIETRGEGGYVITAPSNGGVHPSGQAWVLLQGGFERITTVSEEERECLLDLARSLDQMQKHEAPGEPRALNPDRTAGRPGDEFNSRTSWPQILEPHGWTMLFTAADGNQHWRRPGKQMGTSATISQQGEGVLYVFSTSTDFQAERWYSKFGAYAQLEFGGDFRAAARFLAEQAQERRAATPISDSDASEDALPEPALPAQPFPIEQLPSEAAEYVAELAQSGLPQDFAGLCCLGVLAGAVGGNASIKITQTWTERPALWLALVADTGYRKSPTLREVRRPLDDIQREHFERWKPAIEAWKALPLKERAREQEPKAVRLVLDDATLEALAVVLAQNEAGVALLADELRSLISGLGQYKRSGATDRARLLSLWTGSPVIVDRVVRGTIYIASPTLTVLGGIQPALLSELEGDDGLRERFLIVQADPGYRTPRMAEEVADSPALAKARMGWTQLVWRIAARRQRNREVILSENGRRAFRVANNRYLDLAESTDELPHVGAWARKAPTHLARVILVITDALGKALADRDDVERGSAIIDYFAEHRRRLYLPRELNLLATPADQATDKAVDKLLLALAAVPQGRLRRRDLLRRAIGGVRTAEDVTRLLARYQQTYPGCVRIEAPEGRGRPAEVVYHPRKRPK